MLRSEVEYSDSVDPQVRGVEVKIQVYLVPWTSKNINF